MLKHFMIFLVAGLVFISAEVLSQEDKIIDDLYGKTVQAANDEMLWAFDRNNPVSFVITKEEKKGSGKFRKITYSLYIRTRTPAGAGKKMKAEGLVTVVYKKDRTGHGYNFAYAVQSGFIVSKMTREEEDILVKIDSFWKEFEFSVFTDNKEKVADMIEFPFSGKELGNFETRDDFLNRYDNVITETFKQTVKNSIIVPEQKSKGKKFDYMTDPFIQIFNYEDIFFIGNDEIHLLVEKAGGEYKITGVRSYEI